MNEASYTVPVWKTIGKTEWMCPWLDNITVTQSTGKIWFVWKFAFTGHALHTLK